MKRIPHFIQVYRCPSCKKVCEYLEASTIYVCARCRKKHEHFDAAMDCCGDVEFDPNPNSFEAEMEAKMAAKIASGITLMQERLQKLQQFAGRKYLTVKEFAYIISHSYRHARTIAWEAMLTTGNYKGFTSFRFEEIENWIKEGCPRKSTAARDFEYRPRGLPFDEK
jgi:hypothetical protein